MLRCARRCKNTFDIDNPRIAHHPDNVDCSSCHIANRARARAVRAGGQLLTGLNRYQHPFRPLEPGSEDPTSRIVSQVKSHPPRRCRFTVRRLDARLRRAKQNARRKSRT